MNSFSMAFYKKKKKDAGNLYNFVLPRQIQMSASSSSFIIHILLP